MKTLTYALVLLSTIIYSTSCKAQGSSYKHKYLSENGDDWHSSYGSEGCWMSPVDAAEAPGFGNFKHSVGFLVPDTGMYLVNKDSTLSQQRIHSLGIVVDLSDDNFELIDKGYNQGMFDEISLDSLAFGYVYIRHLDSIRVDSVLVPVIDTLIVQMYRRKQLRLGSFTNEQAKVQLYAQPQYFNPSSLSYTSAAYTVKIPLTSVNSTPFPDSIGWRSRAFLLAIPPDIGNNIPGPSMNHMNLFGYSITFKSMVSSQLGDTMESRIKSEIQNPMNYFGFFQATNDGSPTFQETHYNNAFFTDSKQRHGLVSNGWNSNTPGNAPLTDRYWRSFVHVKYISGVPKLYKTKILRNIYPSPAKSMLTVDLSLQQPQMILLELRDMTGKLISYHDNIPNQSGDVSIPFNLIGVQNGCYMLHIMVGNSTLIRRIIVQ